MEYRIIDADSHLNEPGNVWQDRVPSSMKERAPKMVDLPEGRVGWSFDGGERVTPIGMSAVAGIDSTQYNTAGTPKDKIRPGSYDPHARVEEMEYEMLQAQVLYPSVALTGAHQLSNDPELQMACVRAYNDWLREDFCSVAPDRLIGLPLGPMTGIEDLTSEWRRISKQGARGMIVSTYPNAGSAPAPEDDRFWDEVQDWDYPMHIHFGFVGAGAGLSRGAPPQGPARFAGAFLSRIGANIYKPLCDILVTGLFEKHPKLKMVAVETGLGWIPFYLESMDDLFLRSRWHTNVSLKRMPSEYFKEHVWATFITDPIGVEMRHHIGVDHIMWSTDYPHVASDFPNSQRTAAYELRHVPADEKKKMMRDNAAKLYRLAEFAPA